MGDRDGRRRSRPRNQSIRPAGCRVREGCRPRADRRLRIGGRIAARGADSGGIRDPALRRRAMRGETARGGGTPHAGSGPECPPGHGQGRGLPCTARVRAPKSANRRRAGKDAVRRPAPDLGSRLASGSGRDFSIPRANCTRAAPTTACSCRSVARTPSTSPSRAGISRSAWSRQRRRSATSEC